VVTGTGGRRRGPGDELLQAAAVSVSAPASAPVTMAPVLRLAFLLSDRMGFSLFPVVGPGYLTVTVTLG
jgi:hypothetical protein